VARWLPGTSPATSRSSAVADHGDFNGDLEADCGRPRRSMRTFLGPQLMRRRPSRWPIRRPSASATRWVRSAGQPGRPGLVAIPRRRSADVAGRQRVGVQADGQNRTLDALTRTTFQPMQLWATIIAVPFCGVRCSGGASRDPDHRRRHARAGLLQSRWPHLGRPQAQPVGAGHRSCASRVFSGRPGRSAAHQSSRSRQAANCMSVWPSAEGLSDEQAPDGAAAGAQGQLA